MDIRFKAPEPEDRKRTHVCIWVMAGELQGYKYITLEEAGKMLNQLQQVIWRAEAPVPVEEE